ncbi:MAG: hypothetical protein EOM19_03005 [Candidatus Moranbacteria bacterium]|nr:hypothetical protein [Candidatus Moranbacteria bacterium]
MGARIGFIRKKVQSFTFGERIKKIRNERCLSFSEIAKHTGIQTKYLQAFEEGDLSSLPAIVYVHGFLRAYAKYLEEDPEKFIALFEREREIATHLTPKEIQRNTLNVPFSNKLLSLPSRWLVFLGGMGLCILVFFYIYNEIFHFVAQPTLLISSPLENMSVHEPFILVEGKTDVSTKVFLNERPILVDELGNFSQRVDIGQGRNVLVFRSVNSFGKEVEKVFSVFGEWGGEFTQNQEEKKKFFIEVSEGEEVRLSLKIDDDIMREESFLGGERREYFADTSFVISARDGSRIRISLKDGLLVPLTEVSEEVIEKKIILEE